MYFLLTMQHPSVILCVLFFDNAASLCHHMCNFFWQCSIPLPSYVYYCWQCSIPLSSYVYFLLVMQHPPVIICVLFAGNAASPCHHMRTFCWQCSIPLSSYAYFLLVMQHPSVILCVLIAGNATSLYHLMCTFCW